MEIDIVGPQCHLTAARNINHIFNCKLLTFPHYCFAFFFSFSKCLYACVCVFSVWKVDTNSEGKRSTTGVYKLRTSLFHPSMLSLFLVWTDGNISSMTGGRLSNTCDYVHWYPLWSTNQQMLKAFNIFIFQRKIACWLQVL